MTPDEALIEAFSLGMDESGWTEAVTERAEELLPVLVEAGYVARDEATWWFTEAGVARFDELEGE